MDAEGQLARKLMEQVLPTCTSLDDLDRAMADAGLSYNDVARDGFRFSRMVMEANDLHQQGTHPGPLGMTGYMAGVAVGLMAARGVRP